MGTIHYSLKEMLTSLDIPVEARQLELMDMSSDKFVYSIGHFVTEEVVQKLWNEWNPDLKEKGNNPVFITAFQEMLAEAASLGLRLNRFKEISRILPDSTKNKRNWIKFFEDAIPKSVIKVYLNKEDYQSWISSESNKNNSVQDFKQKIEMMNDGLFYELGLVFPTIDFSPDESLDETYFIVEWNDFKLPPEKGLSHDKVLVNDTVDRLTLLNIKGEEAINPANDSECSIIQAEHVEIVEQAGLTTWDPKGFFVLKLRSKLRHNAAAFVNRLFIDFLFSQLDMSFPKIVEQINKRFDKDFIVQVIRGLLAEEISVRDIKTVFSTLLSVQSTIRHIDLSKYIVFSVGGEMIFNDNNNLDEAKITDYIEMVRNNLKRFISHKYTRGGNTMVVYLMDRKVEERLIQSQKLSNDERKKLIESMNEEIGSIPPTSQNPIILTTVEVRHRLRMEIHSEFPQVAVLSYQELSPDLNIQPVARIYF